MYGLSLSSLKLCFQVRLSIPLHALAVTEPHVESAWRGQDLSSNLNLYGTFTTMEGRYHCLSSEVPTLVVAFLVFISWYFRLSLSPVWIAKHRHTRGVVMIRWFGSLPSDPWLVSSRRKT